MPSSKKKKTPSKKGKSPVKAVNQDNNNHIDNNNEVVVADDKHDTTSKTTDDTPQTSTTTPTTKRKTRSNSTASATSQKSTNSQTNLNLNLNSTTSQKSSRRGHRHRKLSRDGSVDTDKTDTSTHTKEHNDNDNDNDNDEDEQDNGNDNGNEEEDHDGDAVMEDADPQKQQNKKPKKPKQPPQMDVTVHRLRHLEYMPKPIACLCATPAITAHNNSNDVLSSSPQEQDESLLSCFVALSRENGSLELKAANEKFRTIAEIAGYKQKVVNCMTWTCGIKTTTTTTTTTTKGAGSSKNIVMENDNDDDKMDKPVDKSNQNTTSTTTSHQPTLIGGSRDGTLFIVDFTRGILTGVTASGGGGVFALTSLCQHQAGRCCCPTNNNNEKAKATPQACAQLVAAGCEDGSTRIFKVIPEKRRLELVSILPSASGGSVLSVAWRRSNNKGTVLFASLSDGTIRRYDSEDTSAGTNSSSNDAWDTTNPQKSRSYDTSSGGSWKSRLRMTVESLGRNTPTRVWALQALSDGTLVSCDSLGHVQFWDGDTGTLLQSFDQNESKADVLQMAVSLDECKVFATGVDSRVSCIQRPTEQAAQAANDKERKWILSQVQRPHTHDVKAMAICLQYLHEESSGETKTSSREVLCTGGIDTKLCTYFVEGFRKSRPRTLYPWPAFSPVAQAKDARVLIIRRDGQIDLYKLDKAASHPKSASHSRAISEQETHIGTIELDSPCNLVCATISDNGRFLAACDALSLYVFRLAYVPESKGTVIIPTKLSADIKQIKGAFVHLKFGSNDKLFAATSDGSLHIIDMPLDDDDDDNDSNTLCTFAMSLKQKKASKALFPVHSLNFTGDKTYFAALQGGFACSSVRIFACEEDGKTYRAWWSVPELEWPATSLKFLDNGDLVVLCSNFSFYVFDVKKRQLAPWSQESGVPVSENLPHELTSRHDYPIRIANNPASPAKILLGSFGAFALIDLEKKIPQSCKFVPENHVRRWKKRRRSLSGSDNAKAVANPDDVESVICLRYNSILHMDFIADNEMVVVEQPWLSVISSFPAALERKIYGS